MLKIGEFSMLSMLMAKDLRFYEKEGLLAPARVDEWTGCRMYETAPLKQIRAYEGIRRRNATRESAFEQRLHSRVTKSGVGPQHPGSAHQAGDPDDPRFFSAGII